MSSNISGFIALAPKLQFRFYHDKRIGDVEAKGAGTNGVRGLGYSSPINGRPASEMRNPYTAIRATITGGISDSPTYHAEKSSVAGQDSNKFKQTAAVIAAINPKRSRMKTNTAWYNVKIA